MVRKLMKHEWIAILHKIVPVWAVVLGVGLVTRLVYLFANDSLASDILCGSAVVLYILANIVCLVLTAVILLVRFYKNMFSKEGYLTLTLPATAAQHLLAKGITAFCVLLCSLVVVCLSAVLVTFGDLSVEICKAIAYLLDAAAPFIGTDVILFIIEGVVFLLLATLCDIFFFYMIVSLGQLAKKNRVAASVGIYFIFYFAFQFLSTILMILSSTVFAFLDFSELFEDFTTSSFVALGHTVMLVLIAGACALTAVYFLVSRHIITKKLNLE